MRQLRNDAELVDLAMANLSGLQNQLLAGQPTEAVEAVMLATNEFLMRALYLGGTIRAAKDANCAPAEIEEWLNLNGGIQYALHEPEPENESSHR